MNLNPTFVRRSTLSCMIGAGLLAAFPWTLAASEERPAPESGVKLAQNNDEKPLRERPTSRARREERAARQREQERAREKAREEGRDRLPLEELFGEDSPLYRSIKKLGTRLEKELTERFGPDSELADELSQLGKHLEKDLKETFGPGSEFEKSLKELGDDLDDAFGPDSEISRRLRETFKSPDEAREEMKRKDAEKPRAEPRRSAPRPNPEASAKARHRDAQIKQLESMMEKIQKEIQRLRAEEDEDDAT